MQKMNIVILCHAAIKDMHEPHLSAEYQLYTLNIPAKHSADLFEASYLIGFATIKTVVRKKQGTFGQQESKAVKTGERILIVNPVTGVHAKNRYGLTDEIAMEPSILMGAIQETRDKKENS